MTDHQLAILVRTQLLAGLARHGLGAVPAAQAAADGGDFFFSEAATVVFEFISACGAACRGVLFRYFCILRRYDG